MHVVPMDTYKYKNVILDCEREKDHRPLTMDFENEKSSSYKKLPKNPLVWCKKKKVRTFIVVLI